MKLKYLDLEYDCVSAEKVGKSIIIHTGKFVEDKEITYQILGDINFAEVIIEDGTWTETDSIPNSEASIWDELDEAYQSGIDSI